MSEEVKNINDLEVVENQTETTQSATSKIFDLSEIGYKDLDGKFIHIQFDKKQFANILFHGAETLEMDMFARKIHEEGKAEINDSIAAEMLNILPKVYKYRVVAAVSDYIKHISK